LIDAGNHSIDTVAKEAGFFGTERMRRAASATCRLRL
jgi:hypothetical protein